MYIIQFLPHINYCIILWGNTYKTNTLCINILQKRIIRIIHNKPYLYHTKDLFKFNNIFWKQPVGYIFTSGEMPADLIIIKLKQCIGRIINCGLIPKLMIFHQGPSNRGCVTKLGITINKPFIVYTNMNNFFIYNPPHLIKSIRNSLSKCFMFENNTQLVREPGVMKRRSLLVKLLWISF